MSDGRSAGVISGEVLGVQYLRAFAAGTVALEHLMWQINRQGSPVPILHSLASGVDIFFIISGFVIYYSTYGGARYGPGEFLVRRLIRIAPLYWLTTAATVAMLVVLPHMLQSAKLSWPHVLASFSFIPMASPADPDVLRPLVVPGWTLNYEMAFYLLFAVAIVVGRRQPGRIMAIMVSVLLVLGLVGAVFQPPGVTGFYADALMLEFLMGMIIAWAVMRRPTMPTKPMVAVGLIALVVMLVPIGLNEELRGLRFGIPAAFIVFAVATTRAPNIPILRLLGDSSYSLYLSSFFTGSALGQIASRLHLAQSLTGSIAFIVVGYVVTVIGGIVCWKLVEQPMTTLLRRQLFPSSRPLVHEVLPQEPSTSP